MLVEDIFSRRFTIVQTGSTIWDTRRRSGLYEKQVKQPLSFFFFQQCTTKPRQLNLFFFGSDNNLFM